jgi:HAMP domain-containing protein
VDDVVEVMPRRVQVLSNDVEAWEVVGCCFLAVGRELENDTLYVANYVSEDFLKHYGEIEQQLAAYEAQKQQYKAYKAQMVMYLLLFTVLLLFAAMWFALFLSKQVTVPIEALAEGTKAVSAGNFDYRVEVQAQDELGALVRSFNQMTELLGASRRQIEEFTRNLQHAVQELTTLRAFLGEVRSRLRAAGWRPPGGGGRLADLMAYEARVAAAKTWPLDASTLVRLALYACLPLCSWLGSAFAARVVDTLLR